MAISVVTSVSGNVNSADVSFTLPISPVEDDVIFVTVNGIVNGAVDTHPAGWVNVLGEGVLLVPSDSSICMAMLYHVVTEAEDTGDQVTWTMTEFWTVPRAVEVQVAVLRGVDLTGVSKAVGTITNASNSTTHVLPEVLGVNVPDSGDFVLRAVMADDLSTYTTPSGHTQIASSNTNAGSWLGYRDMATTASTTVTAQNIEATLSGESAGFTVIVGVAGGAPEPPNEGSASGTITWAGSATGERAPIGLATGAIGWAGSATGEAPDVPPNEGAATGAISWAGSATGARTPKGSATGTLAWAGSSTGAAAYQGSASGAIGWAGESTGAKVPIGLAVGTIGWAGSATGEHAAGGSATGAISWAGSATGDAPSVDGAEGSASGAISWAGSATGARTPKGSATGTLAWAGAATGRRSAIGAATGSIAWLGTATGSRAPVGAASGAIAWAGSATGIDGRPGGPELTGDDLTTTDVTIERTTTWAT